jgi:hypothetical protein
VDAGRVCPPYTSSQRLDAGARVSLPDGAMYRTPSWGRGILSGAPAPRFDKGLAELWLKPTSAPSSRIHRLVLTWAVCVSKVRQVGRSMSDGRIEVQVGKWARNGVFLGHLVRFTGEEVSA